MPATQRSRLSAAIIALKTLIVNAPSELREALEPLTNRKLIDRCAGFRPGSIDDTTASTKQGLRALATRWLSLSAEIDTHDEALAAITQAAVLTLREAFGIGADSAAEIMILADDNPTWLRAEAAFRSCAARARFPPGAA